MNSTEMGRSIWNVSKGKQWIWQAAHLQKVETQRKLLFCRTTTPRIHHSIKFWQTSFRRTTSTAEADDAVLQGTIQADPETLKEKKYTCRFGRPMLRCLQKLLSELLVWCSCICIRLIHTIWHKFSNNCPRSGPISRGKISLSLDLPRHPSRPP